MNKISVMELRHTIEFVSKKMKLAKAQLETMENDETFTDNDLWLLASSILATFNTEVDDLKKNFDIR